MLSLSKHGLLRLRLAMTSYLGDTQVTHFWRASPTRLSTSAASM